MAYYNTDSQGYITGNNSNWWIDTFNPSAQVNSQFEMSYNQANRQINLAEEAMRSGILMEADQLRQLGINPAAYGNNLSGVSFSGGSTAHPNASSSNPLGPLMSAFDGLAGVASTVAGIKKQRDDVKQRDRELDIAEKNSDTEAKNAESRAKEADANVSVADATKDNIAAQTAESEAKASYTESLKAYTDAQTQAQRIENEVNSGNNQTLRELGLSESEWNSLDGLEFSSEASAELLTKMGFDAGILPGMGVSGEVSGSRTSKTTVKAGDEVTVTFTQVSASTYENLPAGLDGSSCTVSGDGTATCSYALTEKGVAGGTPAEITLTITVETVTTDGGTITVSAK